MKKKFYSWLINFLIKKEAKYKRGHMVKAIRPLHRDENVYKILWVNWVLEEGYIEYACELKGAPLHSPVYYISQNKITSQCIP